MTTTTAVLAMVLAPTPALAAVADDCGPGNMAFVQGDGFDIATIEALVVSGLSAACEGQVVGARFLGNPQGDPDLPSGVLAESYSDEDPCTGLDLVDPRVITNGAITIPLCETSATAGFVDGHDLTDIRLITPAAAGQPAPTPEPTPEPTPSATPPAPGGDPVLNPAPATPDDPAPAPNDPLEPPAATGADAGTLAGAAAVLLLFGAALVRSGRRRHEV